MAVRAQQSTSRGSAWASRPQRQGQGARGPTTAGHPAPAREARPGWRARPWGCWGPAGRAPEKGPDGGGGGPFPGGPVPTAHRPSLGTSGLKCGWASAGLWPGHGGGLWPRGAPAPVGGQQNPGTAENTQDQRAGGPPSGQGGGPKSHEWKASTARAEGGTHVQAGAWGEVTWPADGRRRVWLCCSGREAPNGPQHHPRAAANHPHSSHTCALPHSLGQTSTCFAQKPRIRSFGSSGREGSAPCAHTPAPEGHHPGRLARKPRVTLPRSNLALPHGKQASWA